MSHKFSIINSEITFYLMIWHFVEYLFLNCSSISLLANTYLLLIYEVFLVREVKEGKSILRIRVLLGNPEFNIYIFSYPLNVFFLVIHLSVISPPLPTPILHSCYHLFSEAMPLRSVISGVVLLGALDFI